MNHGAPKSLQKNLRANKSIGFVLVIGTFAGMALLSKSTMAMAALDEGAPQACDRDGCYDADPLSGYGVKPKRTYNLAYDGAPVCKALKDALNNAIRNPVLAEQRITHPVPINMNVLETQGNIGYPGEIEQDKKDPPFYRSQNPIFSNPIFLQWNFLGGYPKPQQMAFQGYTTRDEQMERPNRWMIVPFKNDNIPYLVSGEQVWNVPPKELVGKDWTVPMTYSPYDVVSISWSDKYPQAVTTPLAKFAQVYPLNIGNGQNQISGFDYNLRFPKLSKAEQLSMPWKLSLRWFDKFEFANYQERVYTVLYDASYDLITVLDASKSPGDDLCYLNSSLTKTLEKYTDEQSTRLRQ